MTTKDLVEKIDLKPLSEFEHRDVDGVFVSDMVSDVMAGAKSGNLWLTVQTHKSIVPAANLVDVSAIIITSGKEVPRKLWIWPANSASPSYPQICPPSSWWESFTSSVWEKSSRPVTFTAISGGNSAVFR